MNLKVGDKVYCSRCKEEGVVVGIREGKVYSILVEMKKFFPSYTKDGYYNRYDKEPSLEVYLAPGDVLYWKKDNSKATLLYIEKREEGPDHYLVRFEDSRDKISYFFKQEMDSLFSREPLSSISVDGKEHLISKEKKEEILELLK